MKRKEYIGVVFGRLTVSSDAPLRCTPNGTRHRYVNVVCECGTEKEVKLYHLTGGKVLSCGCLAIERRTSHGMYDTKAYTAWEGMKQRVKPGFNRADRYFDRGITLCERWGSFENFYADMGDPAPGQELDRIDNDLGYFPGNCRWTSKSMNLRNRELPNREHSPYRNVGPWRSKWCYRVVHEGKTIRRGGFATPEAAGRAYNRFASGFGYPMIKALLD